MPLKRQRSILPCLFACTATFLVALDETILSTVIPTITAEFSARNDIAWYGCAYMMTSCVFGLMFSKVYEAMNVKYAFISAVLVFEAGSIVCATAHHSYQLILGRAVAGIGAGGISLGTYVILDGTFSRDKAALYLQLPTIIWAVASGIGPPLGGAITERVSWRLCFYINIPVGVLAIIAIATAMDGGLLDAKRYSVVELLESLNLLDTFILLGGIAALISAFREGASSSQKWNSTIVLTLLPCSALLFMIFVYQQVRSRKHKMIQPRVVRNPIIALGSVIALSNGTVYTISIYILPLYLQLVQNRTPAQSGLLLIPFTLTVSVTSMIGGCLLHLRQCIWGHAFANLSQQMVLGAAITLPGTVLLTLLTVSSSIGIYVAYETVTAMGIGLVMLLPMTASKHVLPNDSTYSAASLTFFRAIGSILGLSIAQTLLIDGDRDLPATYNENVKKALYVSIAYSGFGLLAALLMLLFSRTGGEDSGDDSPQAVMPSV